MPTVSTPQLDRFAREWAALPDYPSSQLSGIVGDRAHEARGGYHIGRRFQSASNYSVTRAEDRPGNGPDDAASAVDMTMNRADMIKCHTRLRNAFRANDPRMRYVNAWNGWDGEGSAGRYDVVTGKVGTATADHKWHIHLEFRRRYCNRADAMDAVLSVLRGEASQEDDVEISDLDAALRDSDSRLAMISKAIPWQYVGGGIPEGMSTLAVLNATYRNSQATADLVKIIAQRDEVDETVLGQQISAALAPALAAQVVAKVTAVLAEAGVGLSAEAIAEAVKAGTKAALREGVGQ